MCWRRHVTTVAGTTSGTRFRERVPGGAAVGYSYMCTMSNHQSQGATGTRATSLRLTLASARDTSAPAKQLYGPPLP